MTARTIQQAIHLPESPARLYAQYLNARTHAAMIELTHVAIPEHDLAGVSEDWEKYYWAPWRAYLQRL